MVADQSTLIIRSDPQRRSFENNELMPFSTPGFTVSPESIKYSANLDQFNVQDNLFITRFVAGLSCVIFRKDMTKRFEEFARESNRIRRKEIFTQALSTGSSLALFSNTVAAFCINKQNKLVPPVTGKEISRFRKNNSDTLNLTEFEKGILETNNVFAVKSRTINSRATAYNRAHGTNLERQAYLKKIEEFKIYSAELFRDTVRFRNKISQATQHGNERLKEDGILRRLINTDLPPPPKPPKLPEPVGTIASSQESRRSGLPDPNGLVERATKLGLYGLSVSADLLTTECGFDDCGNESIGLDERRKSREGLGI